MISLLRFLRSHKVINLFIVIIYFLMVTLPHEWVGKLTAKLIKNFNRDEYNYVILVIGLVLLGIYFFNLLKNLKLNPNKQIPLFYLIITLIFVVISFNTLIIVNIEIIHFIQYAVLAILIFPLFNNFLPALFKVMILGAIDEAYQYYILSPERTDYYDFNDVILNTLGAALGLIYLRSFPGILNYLNGDKKINNRTVWIIWLGIVLSLMVLILAGVVQYYPKANGEDSWTLLVKKVPEGFWSLIHPNVTYHIVQPIEGICCLTALLLFYSYLKKGLNENIS